MTELLDRRLIFITGKGGVGKSTVAIALGLVAARRGLRTIVAELHSQERVQGTFAQHGARFRELELVPGLFSISIDAERAMEEYLRVKAGAVGRAVGASRVFHAFALATPGMRELLSMGKVWELAQLHRRTRGAAPYDVVIVDAPATGHGVGMLRTPKTFAEIARVGPIAQQGRQIAAMIYDRDRTAVVAVATPEEIPVSETLSLRESLEHEHLALDLVIANAVYPTRFESDQVGVLERALARSEEPLARSALRAALSEHARTQTQRAQLDRLRIGLNLDGGVIELPFLFAETLDRAELERLADLLEVQL
ncbi:MAG: ArsA family ATPase [Solirubrobacterales bacterium]|nr:ArsA family ATPase [Solirubrobacterales bacterium]MBV9537230.1 ArsA family ATPase [Solirubrobacterales bacterium]